MNIPNTFLPNTKVKSEEVNANFAACKTAIEDNGTSINTVSQDLADFKETIEPQVMPDFKYEAINGKFAIASDKNKIKLKAGTTIRLNVATDDVRYLEIDADTEYNMNNILDTGVGSLVGGKDYYGYVVAKDVVDTETQITTKTTAIVLSLNSTYPTGYTAANSRKIFGFHTLCVAVTSANAPYSTHPLIGFNSGDILPCSVWCLSHKPICSPEGMTFDEKTEIWVDIYKQSGKDGNPTSVYGATVADNRQWDNHNEDMRKVKKRLPTRAEFISFAEGSNQKTNIAGSAAPTPKSSGGHLDTAGKRMVSDIGCEECCGYMWEWSNDVSANGGSGWTNYDGSGLKGQVYGIMNALLFGGAWGYGAACGSRSAGGDNACSTVNPAIGGRGVSLPLKSA